MSGSGPHDRSTLVTARLQIVCSSANPDKVEEIAAIVGDAFDLLPRPPEVAEVVEDADTLEGNARLKAVALVEATGFPAVADDTGLFVDALDGAPGVWSARYAGPHATYAENRAKLLGALTGIAGRGAHGAVPHGRPRALARRARAQRGGRQRGLDRDRRAGRRRLRLRPRLRAGRRRTGGRSRR